MTGIEIVISFFIILGIFFIVTSSFGLIRLPDLYSRIHAAAKGVTVGVAGVMIAAIIYFLAHGYGFSGKNLLAIIFLICTVPAASHMIARAAYHTGVYMWENTVCDELKKNCEIVKAEAAEK